MKTSYAPVLSAILILLLFAPAAFAGEAVILTVEGDVEKPVRIHGPAPVYPALAKEERIQGRVVAKTVINTDGQVEAIEATGASGGQKLVFGVIPQILPTFAGISVFRWDINIRESTVLGLVGAGGIGLQLNASISALAWTQVSLILLVILATVIVSEWVSARVRHAII